METKLVKIDDLKSQSKDMDMAADLIKMGEIVAFPTETVYGLGADGLNKEAVKKIFKAKGRPQDNPLILHVDSIEMLGKLVVNIPPEAYICTEKFWPGPLTILFKKSDLVPEIITAGLDAVAIRMPSHPIALELIKKAGVPIAAPSANTSGRPSPTRVSHVIEDMSGEIAMIIDGGETGVGLESTVLDLTEKEAMILRPGGITLEELMEVIPNVSIDPGILEVTKDGVIPKSPGQKYRHYAPKASMILFSGDRDKMVQKIIQMARKYEEENKKVGLLVTEENKEEYSFENVVVMGSSKDKKTIAHGLFHAIRRLDQMEVDIILCEAVKEDNIGMAIMNRLLKAAGGNRVNL